MAYHFVLYNKLYLIILQDYIRLSLLQLRNIDVKCLLIEGYGEKISCELPEIVTGVSGFRYTMSPLNRVS